LLEPSLNDILDIMLPEFIEAETARFLKHSLAAEQTARMLAMRQATDNASEMIESLTLERNKARQASITKELIEVVSGSRALQEK
jgi:F-type H+-transporting ATPase subunit gamma